ncbi:MAG: ABC transporter ATP-binding protein [Methanotrichaceae archaeon]|nr:ABC transporter ATP-binding protein [Methanotrichaceae archaeon]
MHMIEAIDLKKHYSSGLLHKHLTTAVDGVSFFIERGETLGLIGESGCGKTTVGRMLLRLIEPTSGKIFFEGIDIMSLNRTELRRIRPRMQMIFQDPESSLNPRMKIGDCIAEPLRLGLNGKLGKKQTRERVMELIEIVGLNPEHFNRYPHQMSGGQNQRAVLARILAIKPDFIVADEPTASLDVSVQAQILNLIQKLKKEQELTLLFISHDHEVVQHMSDRVAIMDKGRIIETLKWRDFAAKVLASETSLPKIKNDILSGPGSKAKETIKGIWRRPGTKPVQ